MGDSNSSGFSIRIDEESPALPGRCFPFFRLPGDRKKVDPDTKNRG